MKHLKTYYGITDQAWEDSFNDQDHILATIRASVDGGRPTLPCDESDEDAMPVYGLAQWCRS